MRDTKIIFGNVRKNIKDYSIYFLTLSISVSLFYSFNCFADQPAFRNLSSTKKLMYDQLNIYMTILSYLVAIILAFLIIYTNNYLLKRRKKELGIYMLLGMKKRRIAKLFNGEAFFISLISLIVGLVLGIIISQGIGLLSLQLFAVEPSEYQIIISPNALGITIGCFALIFIITICFNVSSISKVNLISLLRASRTSENPSIKGKGLISLIFIISIVLIISAQAIIVKNGIIPSRDDYFIQTAIIFLGIGTILLFYSGTVVVTSLIKSNKRIYLKGITSFVVSQINSKFTANLLILSIVTGLLTITICGMSTGVSMALEINRLSNEQVPYDLNVYSNISMNGESDILEHLYNNNLDLEKYAEAMEEISVYNADITYGDILANQELDLWPMDAQLPETPILVVSISDFNKAMSLQGKEAYMLGEDEFYLNCNYDGTIKYMEQFYNNANSITIAGNTLKPVNNNIISETFYMTSIGNNDRGSLVVPDNIVSSLQKDCNIVLVQYKPTTNPDDVFQPLIPIGLDERWGYRYTESNMMHDMYYGVYGICIFVCFYLSIIFLLICVALLSVKQLTEVSDNAQRYGLLRKIGVSDKQLNRSILIQVGVFFGCPIAIATIYSIIETREIIKLIEGFMNLHVATNFYITIILFLVIYGLYFVATYVSSKAIIRERKQ
ncbi:permease, domain protein [Candidatus Epulonipiscium fishelsonii]|uniref:Permease, domain protein n=1 Tax=Candidatus Epulonipiscium fishelsonii TaxID=77094 RepID=A0ACC8XF81_9FIRM|nr:permease, domain protein [Epulopiscium sp. SCG-B11WGA-EpuloA1]ONI42093.1 permease, domain protein [Epulopiscium sp. SCG-B05WGA-EpuloA1]